MVTRIARSGTPLASAADQSAARRVRLAGPSSGGFGSSGVASAGEPVAAGLLSPADPGPCSAAWPSFVMCTACQSAHEARAGLAGRTDGMRRGWGPANKFDQAEQKGKDNGDDQHYQPRRVGPEDEDEDGDRHRADPER